MCYYSELIFARSTAKYVRCNVMAFLCESVLGEKKFASELESLKMLMNS